MCTVLRILAGLVMALGVAALVILAVAVLLGLPEMPWRDIFTGYLTDSAMLAGIAITLGGALWALTRIAYGQPASAIPDPSRLADPRPPQVRLYGTGSVLRILGMVQIGIGVMALGAFFYWYLTEPNAADLRGRKEIFLLIGAGVAWGYSCLGGMLFALTRIAYPPTPLAAIPGREAPPPRPDPAVTS